MISASVLSADFANLGKEVTSLSQSGVDYLHIDVMDGMFVPCISFGDQVVKSLKRYSKLPIDVHLMVNDPESKIEHFVLAGADMITFHVESVVHATRLISNIKSHGKKAGIALVPSTHQNNIEYLIDSLDIILVMTVSPGFGGQCFLYSQLKKIESIKKIIEKYKSKTLISVDGGINLENAKIVKEAGADIFVIGSALFLNDNYFDSVKKFKNILLK